MDPITIALMGGTALSGLLQGNAQRDQAERALQMQQALAQEQMKFAKAGRTDAYGNKVYFDPTTNEWKTQLDPFQDRLVKAGEAEQFRGLTHDAAQNRSIRDAAAQRGRTAGDYYDRLAGQYVNQQPPSEGSIEDELIRLGVVGSDVGYGPNVSRTAGNLPYAISGVQNYQTPLARLAQIIAGARGNAINERNNRATARNNQFLPAMQSFERTAMGGQGSVPDQSTTPKDLMKESGDMAKTLVTAQNNTSRNIGNAFNQTITAAGKPYEGLVKAMSMYKSPTNKTGTNTNTQGYYGGSPETNPLLNPNTYNYYNDQDWRQRQQNMNNGVDTFDDRFYFQGA